MEKNNLKIPVEMEISLEKFREHLLAGNYSRHTVKGRYWRMKYFINWLITETAVRKWSEVTDREVNAYRLSIYYARNKKGSPYSIEEQRSRLFSVKGFFRYLYRKGEILYNPAGEIETPKVKKVLPKDILTVEEMEKVLVSPDPKTNIGMRDRAILELLYSTGMRVSELSGLKREDIYSGEEKILIREGKGGRERIAPVGRIARQVLREYMAVALPKLLVQAGDSGHLFLSKSGKRMHNHNIWELIKKYGKKAGIVKNVNPHSIRHTCATHMLKGGADIRYIQQLLGHRSIDTTQIYTRVENGDLKAVHERCHPREKENEGG